MVQENEAIVIIMEGTDAEMVEGFGCCFVSFMYIY